MPLDLQLFSDKLARYLEQFQLSIPDLVDSTGILEKVLTELMRGTREPTGDEILILADFFKADYRFFISNERLASFEQTDQLFRMHGADFSKEDRWSIQEFLFLCECEEFLMRNTRVDDRKPFDFVKRGNYFKRHGEEAAASLRIHLGYANTEISRNVFHDLRRIGIHVFRRKLLNSNISGVFIRHPVAGPCVLVNYHEDIYRQRFTAAHEGGHAILDNGQDVIVSYEHEGSELPEVRANTFASRYLLPPAFLQKLPPAENWDADRLIEYSNKFLVNPAALLIALEGSQCISADALRRLRGLKIPMSAKSDPELPASLSPLSRNRRTRLFERGLSNDYANLCFDAYESATISSARLAEMLLINHRELGDIADLFGRRLNYAN